MAKENTAIYIILGLLNHEAMTGYDIKKRIDTSISNFWDIGYGQIYPTLKVLEQDGDVTKNVENKEKGPDRIVYSISESGRKKLQEWLARPSDTEYVKYEILLKLFFGSQLPIGENMERISNFREKNLKTVEAMEQYRASLEEVLAENVDHYYYYLTVLFGQHVYKAYLDWADEAISILERLKRSTQ